MDNLWILLISLLGLSLLPPANSTACNYGLSQGLENSTSESLVFCKQYQNNSCCVPSQASELKQSVESLLALVYGQNGCYDNIVRLFCGWTCDPNQKEFTILSGTGNNTTLDVYVDQSYAEKIYQSCKDVCLKFGGGRSVEETYGDSLLDFLQQFNSAKDPNYVRGPTHPDVVYNVGVNPQTNIGISNLTVVPGSGTDLDGCPARQTVSSTGFCSSPSLAISLLIFMFGRILQAIVS